MEEEKNVTNEVVNEKFTPAGNDEPKPIKIKVITLLLIILVIIALIGGAIYLVSLNKQKVEARKAVEEIFESIKACDEQAIKENLKNEEIFNNSGENEEVENNTENNVETNTENEDEEIFNRFFSTLNYEIINTEADFHKATVEVNVSNKNIGKIFQNYFNKALELSIAQAFSSTGYNEQKIQTELDAYLNNQIVSEEIEIVTNTIHIDLEKQNNEWKVSNTSQELIEVVLPGFVKTINELQSSFGQFQNAE